MTRTGRDAAVTPCPTTSPTSTATWPSGSGRAPSRYRRRRPSQMWWPEFPPATLSTGRPPRPRALPGTQPEAAPLTGTLTTRSPDRPQPKPIRSATGRPCYRTVLPVARSRTGATSGVLGTLRPGAGAAGRAGAGRRGAAAVRAGAGCDRRAAAGATASPRAGAAGVGGGRELPARGCRHGGGWGLVRRAGTLRRAPGPRDGQPGSATEEGPGPNRYLGVRPTATLSCETVVPPVELVTECRRRDVRQPSGRDHRSELSGVGPDADWLSDRFRGFVLRPRARYRCGW